MSILGVCETLVQLEVSAPFHADIGSLDNVALFTAIGRYSKAVIRATLTVAIITVPGSSAFRMHPEHRPDPQKVADYADCAHLI